MVYVVVFCFDDLEVVFDSTSAALSRTAQTTLIGSPILDFSTES